MRKLLGNMAGAVSRAAAGFGMVWLIVLPSVCMAAGAPSDQPNIVVYLVDDMGWMDTSVPFAGKPLELNKRYHTPNMERLAREGMVFSNAYAAPVCTPSRVSLMTGMNAAHHKVTQWTSIEKDTPSDFDSDTTPLRPAEWNVNGLSPVAGIARTQHATPLPRLLQDAGYFTVHAGKAHFASMGTPGSNPLNLGFVVNIAGSMAGQPEDYYAEKNFGNTPEGWSHRAVQNMSEYYGSHVYLTDALTSEALKPLEYPIKQQKPFFLYFGQFAVHLPNQANPAFVDKYLAAGLSKQEAGYASMIESMDKSLGDILDFLDRRGVADNTVVLFMSDNGGNSISPAKGGVMHHGNAPLREGKGSVYEGGIREPMIVRWPGVVKAGTVTDAPVIIEDYFPTLLEIAGVKNPQTVQQVDGKSFVPTLKDAAAGDRERALAWNYPNKWKKDDQTDIDFLAAWRQGDWKLVYRMTTGALELYNLKTDLGEQHDLSADQPDRVKDMARAMSKQFRAWGAQMPIEKKSGKAVPLPDELPQVTAE
jgi:arylsulfatase A-like enzyme